MTTRVLFFHGLEGSPEGHKPTHLRALPDLDVVAPRVDTRLLIQLLVAEGRAPHGLPNPIAAPLVETATRALADAAPDVVVGSSFGGGLAMELAKRELWRGPLVLLAPAGDKLFGIERLSQPARVAVVHGRDDEVIPYADSVALAASSSGDVSLTLVDDEHRLRATVDGGWIERAIAWATKQTDVLPG